MLGLNWGQTRQHGYEVEDARVQGSERERETYNSGSICRDIVVSGMVVVEVCTSC
jgi:hypothetical protein